MAAAEEDNILMYTVLEYNNKPAHVYLTATQIIIENNNRPRSHDRSLDARPSNSPLNQVIPLREVITVRAEKPSSKETHFHFKANQKSSLSQDDRTNKTNTFSIFAVNRLSRHRWRHKCSIFVCKDYGTCQIWIDKIQELLKNPEFNRPRRLLVFINPFGGKRKAPKIFNNKVRPLFELAGIYSEVIVTKRQNHARNVIFEYDLASIDGIICVGGDGTFSELLNGLLDRVNSAAGVEQTFRHQPVHPDLRIGVIPGGSTDAVVYSIVGINDPITSTLQIILGDSIGVDVTAVYKKEEFLRYTVTMSSYGYYGDLLKDSENLRWMGPTRYTWSGAKTFMSNKAYEGEVSFLLASEEDGHTRDHVICYNGSVGLFQLAPLEKFSISFSNHSISDAMHCCEKCQKAVEKNKELVTVARESQVDCEIPPAVKEGWHRVKGKFCAINLVTISCRCDLSPIGMCTSSHLGDGCMDLILIQECSRLQYLRHLIRIPDLKADQFNFDFIQVYRIKEFSFQPAVEPEDVDEGEGEVRGGCRGKTKDGHTQLKSSPNINSVWNCDGEVLDYPTFYAQVHCQLLKFFGRGIEEQSEKQSLSCPSCCSAYEYDK